MGSRLVNPTREDQLMEVSSKSRLFTLKHLNVVCICLIGKPCKENKKTKKQSFISSGACHVEAASGCSVFFLVFFFVCFSRVITGSKRIAFALNFDSFVFSSFFL